MLPFPFPAAGGVADLAAAGGALSGGTSSATSGQIGMGDQIIGGGKPLISDNIALAVAGAAALIGVALLVRR